MRVLWRANVYPVEGEFSRVFSIDVKRDVSLAQPNNESAGLFFVRLPKR